MAGAALVASMLFFAGSYAAHRLVKRTQLLGEVCTMITLVRTQLEFCCRPVDSIVGILASSPEIEGLLFIPACCELLDTLPFPDAWKESLAHRQNTSYLSRSDVDKLVCFGSSLGTTALDGQLANCDMYSADFAVRLSEAREQCAKYSKILPSLGALAGAAVVIAAI